MSEPSAASMTLSMREKVVAFDSFIKIFMVLSMLAITSVNVYIFSTVMRHDMDIALIHERQSGMNDAMARISKSVQEQHDLLTTVAGQVKFLTDVKAIQ